MTDNEIIKALECCIKCECSSCQLFQWGSRTCGRQLQSEALSIINRQKAELAELQSELIITKNNFDNAKDRYDEAVKIGQKMNEKLINSYKKLQTAKSEARKEFVERLKEKSEHFELEKENFVSEADIDSTLAEMESERG